MDPPLPSRSDSSHQSDVDSRGESAAAPTGFISADSSTLLATVQTQHSETSQGEEHGAAREEDEDEHGLLPQEREIMKESPSQENLRALFAIYKSDKTHEERCKALKEIRVRTAIFWDEIFSTQSIVFKKEFLNNLIQTFTTETDGELLERLADVAGEAAKRSIDSSTGSQTWSGISRFVNNCLKSDNVSLKRNALLILSKAPNLFGQDNKTLLCVMKTALNDANFEVQSDALKSLFFVLHVGEYDDVDFSPLIPIFSQRAEERLAEGDQFNESFLIGSVQRLAEKFPSSSSFCLGSTTSIVKKAGEESRGESAAAASNLLLSSRMASVLSEKDTAANDQNDETDEDGLLPHEREKLLKDPPSHEKWQALLEICKSDKCHEERCMALQELCFNVPVFWNEIFSTQWTLFKKEYLNYLLQTLTTETNYELLATVTSMAEDAAKKSIDKRTGVQTWEGIVGFMEKCLNYENPLSTVPMKKIALSILSAVPNLFGQDIKSFICFMKTTLNDANINIQSTSIECLFEVLRVEKYEDVDFSPLIPIFCQIAEERLAVADKFKEFELILSLPILAHNFPGSFSLRSIISIVRKGLNSTADESLKGLLMPALVNVLQSGGNGDAITIDLELYSNILGIVQCCKSSGSEKLKEGLQHIERIGEQFKDVGTCKRVIVTDFISTSESPGEIDTRCFPFTEDRESAQERVQMWNCACDLIPALRSIEGSTEQGGIALAIISCHGIIIDNELRLKISEKSNCKRCAAPIPLSKVMAALDSTKLNIACAVFASGVQKGPGGAYGICPTSLATRYVSLLQLWGPSGTTRKTLLKMLGKREVRKVMAFLHGIFALDKGRKKVNETPIEVMMHDEWMRDKFAYEKGGKKVNETPIDLRLHPEFMRYKTNEVVITVNDRLEEPPAHEKLLALFTIYRDDTYHEDRSRALEQLRFLVAFNWEEIVSTHSIDSKTPFLNDLLEALANEKDGILMEKIALVVVEAAMNSIDPTTGCQMWPEVVSFIKNNINSDNVPLKMISFSILSNVPNLIEVNDTPMSFIETSLCDPDQSIKSAAMRWILSWICCRRR